MCRISSQDKLYMGRCLELARLGLGRVQPNPMVGAVIVHQGRIIGEGYHQQYGEAHAEVNAIRSMDDPSLCREATLYVNLEPCSHYGKTPPCADKIIEMEFPRVVIGTLDPHSKVNGQGIAKMENAGIEVLSGVLSDECEELNRRFFTYHRKQRPYIILKWAQTADGYMDIPRTSPAQSYWITNEELKVMVHKWRSEEQAILVGYNTYCNDHPQLTTRLYPGTSPQRYIMCHAGTTPPLEEGFTLLSDQLPVAMQELYHNKIESIIVEGGRKTLDLFLKSNLWDEIRVLTGEQRWGAGTRAPQLNLPPERELEVCSNHVQWYRNRSL